MLFFLSDYKIFFGPFRLFEYVTFRAAGAAITALLLTLLLGPLTVRLLKNSTPVLQIVMNSFCRKNTRTMRKMTK